MAGAAPDSRQPDEWSLLRVESRRDAERYLVLIQEKQTDLYGNATVEYLLAMAKDSARGFSLYLLEHPSAAGIAFAVRFLPTWESPPRVTQVGTRGATWSEVVAAVTFSMKSIVAEVNAKHGTRWTTFATSGFDVARSKVIVDRITSHPYSVKRESEDRAACTFVIGV